MKKKLISVFAILLLILNLITVMPVQAAGERVTVEITPDKTEVKAGDTITYTVSFEIAEPCYTLQLNLGVPEGLTYVANSGKINSDLVAQLSDLDVVEFAEATKAFLIGGDHPFELNEKVVVGTFQCTVDSTAAGEYTVGLSYMQVADKDLVSIPEADRNIVTNPIEVIVSVEGISLNKTETTINVGNTETLTATIDPNNATNQKVTWNSSDTSVATVSDQGVVNAVKPGNTVITATTEDGSYKATCDVTVVCPHTNKTTHPAKASTCLEQGNEEYVTCDDCGEVISGKADKLPLADHQYGTLIPEVPAIHTDTQLVDGTKAHYECAVCHKLFDENKQEVSEADLVIKATHQYGNWVADTEEHWQSCGCGSIMNLGKHTGGEATCQEQATCEICGVKYGQLDPDNHVYTEIRDEVPSTCTQEGYSGDIYCSDCGKLITKGTVIGLADHKGGEATCISKAVCEVCGAEYGDLDTRNHLHTEIRNEVAATADKEGYSGDLFCLDCGRQIDMGAVIPALGETEQENPDKEQPTTDNKEENNQQETTDPTRPQTDDISNITLWVSLLVISGICLVVIAKCKTKTKVAKH